MSWDRDPDLGVLLDIEGLDPVACRHKPCIRLLKLQFGIMLLRRVVVASLAIDKLARGLASSVWSWSFGCFWIGTLN
jgi:hypothetical protein